MTDPEILNLKMIIAEAAAQEFGRRGDDFTLENIAKAAGVQQSELFVFFPNKKAMLDFWYESLIIRYRFMLEELDGYESLTLSEKLTNLMLVLLDMMEEQRPFVQASFNRRVIVNRRWHPFKKELDATFEEVIESHPGVSQAARVFLWDEFFAFLADEYLQVVEFWLSDESENRQKSMALIDKLAVFVSEILCNRVVDSGIDLIRFFWQEGVINVDINVPFVGRIKSGPVSGGDEK